jgi:hypothetical protein
MKTRTCFVSNSSSCSFILQGFVLDDKKYKIVELMNKIYSEKDRNELAQCTFKKDWNELNEDELNDCSYELRNDRDIIIEDSDEAGCPSGKIMVGHRIRISDEGEETRIFTAKTMNKSLDDLLKLFPDEEQCIVTGTMMC